jgi:5-bromo-4-chloroindolyl phosphate hydrolysis protein
LEKGFDEITMKPEEEQSYTEFMSDVDDVRKLAYKILWEQYAIPKGMTKQEMYNECIDLGLKDFMKMFPEVQNLEEAKIAIRSELKAMTENECVESFCDMGVTKITEREYGCQDCMDFFKEFYDKYENEIRELMSKQP